MGPGYIFTGPEGEPWQAEGPIWSVAIQFPRPLKMGQLVSRFHGLTPFFLFCFPLSFIYLLVFFIQQVFLARLATPLCDSQVCHFKSFEEVERRQNKRKLCTCNILSL